MQRKDRTASGKSAPRAERSSSPQNGPSYEASASPGRLLQRARAAPGALSPRDIVGLQRALGNRAVGSLLDGARSAAARAPIKEPAPASDGPGRSMPHDVQAPLERAFDADFSAVRIHEGPEANALGAVAFTKGADIYFSHGRYSPYERRGLELLGHELAHVVQQSQGRVRATTQAKGAEINDDPALEREADEWGARAARGESVAAQLGAMGAIVPVAQRSVIQRSVTTKYGEFKPKTYEPFLMGGEEIGATLDLEFAPGENVEKSMFGFVQSVKSIKDGKASLPSGDYHQYLAKEGLGKDYAIDQFLGHSNPIYGSYSPGIKHLYETPRSEASEGEKIELGSNTNYELGYRSGKKQQSAWMHDRPKMKQQAPGAEQVFETTVLAISGEQKGQYYGSVSWGWRRTESGFNLLPLEKASDDTPTGAFMAAAEAWGNVKVEPGIAEARDDSKSDAQEYRTTRAMPIELRIKNESPDKRERFILRTGSRIIKKRKYTGQPLYEISLYNPIMIDDGDYFWCYGLSHEEAEKEVSPSTEGDLRRRIQGYDVTIRKGAKIEKSGIKSRNYTELRIASGIVDLGDASIDGFVNTWYLEGGKTMKLPGINGYESEPESDSESESESEVVAKRKKKPAKKRERVVKNPKGT